MSKKNYFFGKYFKFIGNDGFSFAFIKSYANEGNALQLILKEKSYVIDDTDSIQVHDNIVIFNVNQDDLCIEGRLELDEFHPLKHKVMGPFTYLPMQCSHEIYSMFHRVDGTIIINGITQSFDNNLGYIEGDSGTSFPDRYIWYNSITSEATITLAIATIPLFGFIHFKGILCFIKTKDDEYRFCTYNCAKAKLISEKQIIVKKGKYRFILDIPELSGHDLKAPVNGNMSRYIKENLCIPTKYKLLFNNKVLLEKEDELSSLEYMWN